MTVKYAELCSRSVRELAKRRAQKNKALECELIGIEINRHYKAKKRVNAMRGVIKWQK